jgi:hypothetical protein
MALSSKGRWQCEDLGKGRIAICHDDDDDDDDGSS